MKQALEHDDLIVGQQIFGIRQLAPRGGVEESLLKIPGDLFARTLELREHRMVLQDLDVEVVRGGGSHDEGDDGDV